ncbi:MAG: hypothetical protein HOP33_17450 [Verrucomicrobia bacterium]|nr:hypothetical protein [Verrucomicrobiota bacterium]
MAREPIEMLVEAATLELPDTKTLRLKWPEGHNPEFLTGQFITIYWADAPEYKRAYSLSSCSLDRGFYDVTVKREGKMGTRVVDWAKAGQKLLVLPPAGKFLPDFAPGRELICIAGGSGVTPFRAFAREATRRKLPNKITVLYSVRTTNDIIFEREFRDLALENTNFNFYVTCTRLHAEDKWTGRRGRIDAAWVREQIHDPANTVFYACGPNPLVEFAEQLVVQEMGVPKAQMKTEKWG